MKLVIQTLVVYIFAMIAPVIVLMVNTTVGKVVHHIIAVLLLGEVQLPLQPQLPNPVSLIVRGWSVGGTLFVEPSGVEVVDIVKDAKTDSVWMTMLGIGRTSVLDVEVVDRYEFGLVKTHRTNVTPTMIVVTALG